MKKIIYTAILGACVIAATACADLGFGVDVDSGPDFNPYWYGNGYLGNTYWDTPVWNYGPIYHPLPPRPPFINTNPGPVLPPPQRPQRPPQVNPGVNGVPTTVGGIQRPGNGGLPNPSNVPTGKPIRN